MKERRVEQREGGACVGEVCFGNDDSRGVRTI